MELVRCSRVACLTKVSVDRAGDLPDGWVRPERKGRAPSGWYERRFCSSACLERFIVDLRITASGGWSRPRPVPPPTAAPSPVAPRQPDTPPDERLDQDPWLVQVSFAAVAQCVQDRVQEITGITSDVELLTDGRGFSFVRYKKPALELAEFRRIITHCERTSGGWPVSPVHVVQGGAMYRNRRKH